MWSLADGRCLMLLLSPLLLLLQLQLLPCWASQPPQKWTTKLYKNGKFNGGARPILLPGFNDDTEYSFSTLYEPDQQLTVHREALTKTCYVIRGLRYERPSMLYPITGNLPSAQMRKLVGNMAVDFCIGYRKVIAKVKPVSPVVNGVDRRRRNAGNGYPYQPRGRYRGQTQSQYLNFGSNESAPGKAEAESTREGSRAVVSGTSGMGQAQSQSFGSNCEDCYDSQRSQNQALSLNGRGYGEIGSPYGFGNVASDLYPGTAGKADVPGSLLQTKRPGGNGYVVGPPVGQAQDGQLHPGSTYQYTDTKRPGETYSPDGKILQTGGQIFNPGSQGYTGDRVPQTVGQGSVPTTGLQTGQTWSQQGVGRSPQDVNYLPVDSGKDSQGRPLFQYYPTNQEIPISPGQLSQTSSGDQSGETWQSPQSGYGPSPGQKSTYPSQGQVQPGQGHLQPGQGQFQPGQGHLQPGQGNLQHGQGQQLNGYGQGKLLPGHGQLQTGQGKVQTGQGQIQPGLGQLQPGHSQLQPGQGQTHSGQGQHHPGYGQQTGFGQGQQQLQPGQRQQFGQGQYQPGYGQGQLQPGQGHLQTGREQTQIGQGHLQTGQGHLQTGPGQLQSGQGQLLPGYAQSQPGGYGQGQLKPGYGQLQPGQGQLQSGLGKLQPGQGQLQPGQGQLQPGQGQLQPGQGQLQPGQGQPQPGFGQYHSGQGQLQPAQGKLQPGQGQMQAGYDQSQPVQGQVQPGRNQYQSGQGQFPSGQGQLQSGYGLTQHGHGQIQPGVYGHLQPGQGQSQSGYGQLQPGQGQLQPGQGQLQPGQGQLQPGQGQLQPGQGQPQIGQGQSHSGYGQLQPDQGQLQPGQGQYQHGRGPLQPGQGQVPLQLAGGSLQPGGGQFQPGQGHYKPDQSQLESGYRPENGQARPGYGHLSIGQGQGQLQPGGIGFQSGGVQLQPGVEQLQPGVGQLQPGVGQLQPGVGQLQPGVGQLPPGVGQLQPGVGHIPPGVGQLQPGVGQLQPGIGQLPGGGQFQPGVGQLQPGVGQLQPGGGQPGQGQLQPGQGQFQPGQGQLQPGQGQLQPGQGQLQPGQSQFYPGQGQLQPGQQKIQPGPGQLQYGQQQPGGTQTYQPGPSIYPSNIDNQDSYNIPSTYSNGQTYPGKQQIYINGQRGPTITDDQRYPGSQSGGSGTGTSVPSQPQWTGREDYDGFPQTNVLQQGGVTTSGVTTGEGPGSIVGDDNSQAEASVHHVQNETQASASSMGTHDDGVSQTQISGTYSGSGSFSAQAQSSDRKRGAQSQISVGKMGAMSSAQGNSGFGQSQAILQLGTDSGATKAEAQSGGWNHGTNTQVQTSEKGGMADAQANGPGITSSQAQIGFQPYQENNKDDSEGGPFRGGGTASAQSGKYAGQSQTQIHGKFKYSISYNGAAQAESGTRDGSFNRTAFKPLDVFNRNPQRLDREVNQFIPNDGADNKRDSIKMPVKESMSESESKRSTLMLPEEKLPKLNFTNTEMASRHSSLKSDNEESDDKNPKFPNTEDYEDGDDDEEYDGDFTSSTDIANQNPQYPYNQKEVVVQQMGNRQKQHIILGSLENSGAHVVQDSASNELKEGMLFQPGEVIPGTQGYTIPIGFRGRVTSVSGNETYSFADDHGESQAQTVTLTPGSRNITYSEKPVKTQSLRSWSAGNRNNGIGAPLNKYNLRNSPENYVTVTKSITGTINTDKDNPAEDKKFSHTYYTKSSTCGYFTFSCNIVYGSNGRTKICRPKAPTNPDGTPVQC